MGIFKKKEYKEIQSAPPVQVPYPSAMPLSLPSMQQTNKQNEALKELRNYLQGVIEWINSKVE